MWKLGLVCALFAGANAAISSAGAAAGASSGGYAGGYGGAYPAFIVPPYVGFGYNNFDVNNWIQSNIRAIQNRIASQFAANQAFIDTLSAYPYYASNYNGPSYSSAAAGGAVGPGGVYQSTVVSSPGYSNRFGNGGVSVYTSPNVNTRFGPGNSVSTVAGTGGPGYQGVSTFVSSNSDGQRTGITSVNDNGRVSTYYH
jgi:hypothetical protein